MYIFHTRFAYTCNTGQGLNPEPEINLKLKCIIKSLLAFIWYRLILQFSVGFQLFTTQKKLKSHTKLHCLSSYISGIVLSWNMPPLDDHETISSYQLFAYQETNSVIPSTSLWKKVS